MIFKNSTAIFWFRRDLRLYDNHAFFQALTRHERVIPIFIFDRNILDHLREQADKRVTFIYQAVSRIHEELAKIGSSLWTFYGTPSDAFQQLLKDFDIEAVYTNGDYEPYALERDSEIAEILSERNKPFHSLKDQVLFEKGEVLTGTGKPYTVYTPYKKKWLATLSEEDLLPHPCENHFDRLAPFDEPLPLIPLEEMGFKKADVSFPSTQLITENLCRYGELRDYPAEDITSYLGVHLRFGTLSIRELVRKARDLDPVWLAQLIWRDFFHQILFHFPEVTRRSFRPDYDRVRWRNNRAEFELWKKGETGIPIVDAGMRELNETGFMHNRVRMITASFLCKHLLIDWRWGERYFASKLMDFDLASNNGNWQWVAGSGCDASPWFRVFNPWLQAQKFDKQMHYIRKWVPEFLSSNYPLAMVDHDFARKRAKEVYGRALNNEPPGVDESETPLFP